MRDFKFPDRVENITEERKRVAKKAEMISSFMKYDKDFTKEQFVDFRETVLDMSVEIEFMSYIQGFYNIT